MTTALLIAAVVFCAALAQTLSGFGFALILMPIATLWLGLRTAAPLVALTALTAYTLNLIRYRQAVDVREVLRLGAASALGIPAGLWALANVDESIIRPLLGLVLIAYAVYRLIRPAGARACSPRWVYLAGFVAGCLGGAYNTPGPPVILYGSLRRWPRQKFRAVLQTFFFFNGALVVASHYAAHRLTPAVLTFYAYAAPALLLGILAGSRIDSRLNHDRFRAIVTAMILLLGLSLALGLGKR
ncbi:MAG TPA: sulfite exporter TauE/SafE family protein [Thermoflexia bacterium]|nr:sulfite exporter TauE/SafE family protein [Thermoflexia bacterium]